MTSSNTASQTCPYADRHGKQLGYCPKCHWTEEAPAKVTQPPSIGRIVLYKLNEIDAEGIRAIRRGRGIIANVVQAGDVFPAIVVRTWPTSVQLQVFLDGPDTFWATSVTEGDGERQWSWPPRV